VPLQLGDGVEVLSGLAALLDVVEADALLARLVLMLLLAETALVPLIEAVMEISVVPEAAVWLIISELDAVVVVAEASVVWARLPPDEVKLLLPVLEANELVLKLASELKAAVPVLTADVTSTLDTVEVIAPVVNDKLDPVVVTRCPFAPPGAAELKLDPVEEIAASLETESLAMTDPAEEVPDPLLIWTETVPVGTPLVSVVAAVEASDFILVSLAGAIVLPFASTV
jgi:hypothetical protein